MEAPDELTTLDGERVVTLARLTELHPAFGPTLTRLAEEGRLAHVATSGDTRYYRPVITAAS